MVVYKITNLINGKIYIGATQDFQLRWRVHRSNSKRKNYPISKAIRDYGINNFKFQAIEIEPDKETMYEREKYYIKLYNAIERGYNCTEGGIDGKVSQKTKKNMRVSWRSRPKRSALANEKTQLLKKANRKKKFLNNVHPLIIQRLKEIEERKKREN